MAFIVNYDLRRPASNAHFHHRRIREAGKAPQIGQAGLLTTGKRIDPRP
jgi:hypothetical protein